MEFLLTLILSSFSVSSVILIPSKNKINLSCNTSFFVLNKLLIYFSLIPFNLIFFFFWQIFVSISWLFLYCFLVFWIILSSFFFRISFSCILQDFFSVKPVTSIFYSLICQVNKKVFFNQFITPIE